MGCVSVLLTGLAILVASGWLALVASRWPRLCAAIGSVGAVAGCALGLLPAFQVLLGGAPLTLRLAWSVPYGSFYAELDRLSAFFVAPILGLCGLAAVYGAEYLLAHANHKSLGRGCSSTCWSPAWSWWSWPATRCCS